ncbi:hypothetical protein GN958_ATG16518 [Phytophthora infestans]|uniref:Uncharacterized protein n=1 Tax=Phytophthora infestans TaxID=4787 RepID=A0A8S9U115_PHYIN|nr:hypothetical protein GN958_ATG16518 [Phytophthora infestans]
MNYLRLNSPYSKSHTTGNMNSGCSEICFRMQNSCSMDLNSSSSSRKNQCRIDYCSMTARI